MLITSQWGPQKSFSLIPIEETCPYIECIYNPGAKTLAVIGKTKKDKYQMVPKLNDDGQPQKSKSGTPENPYKMQRVVQETFSEYYLTDRDDVENFIKRFAVNEKDFDYEKALDMPMMDAPTEGLVQSPTIIT